MYRYKVLSDQGNRREMEDRCAVVENPDGSGVLYGGVFDGHRSKEVAEICEEKLGAYFLERLFSSKPRNARSAFDAAYHRLGLELMAKIPGSCAATFCLDGDMLTAANVGDCRIILISQKDWCQLTVDHTPENPEERKRVFDYAGPEKLVHHCGRLCLLDDRGVGSLQVSRSFGDATFRRSGLNCAPHLAEYRLNGEETCLIAASDGLFGAMRNEEVAKAVRASTDFNQIPSALMELAKTHDSTDNITILAVDVRR